MKLSLIAPGASDDQIQNALLMAEAVFEKAGITPERGALGVFALESWDIRGFDKDSEPPAEDHEAASVYWEANNVAMRACYGDAMPPSGAGIELPRQAGSE